MTKIANDESKCVACVAIKTYKVKDVHRAFTVGMMIGVGVEGAGLTPTFCKRHLDYFKEMGVRAERKMQQVVKESEVETKRSIQ